MMTQAPIATRRGTLLLAAGGLALPAFAAGRAAAQETPGACMAATMAAGAFASGAGQLGREKGGSPLVRQLAEPEIGEIAAVVEALSGAGAPPRPPPQTVEGEKAAMITQLQQAPAGPEFDRLFVEAQLMGHQEGLAIQRALSDEQTITVPVATAKIAEPSILSHIAMLEPIQGTLG